MESKCNPDPIKALVRQWRKDANEMRDAPFQDVNSRVAEVIDAYATELENTWLAECTRRKVKGD